MVRNTKKNESQILYGYSSWLIFKVSFKPKYYYFLTYSTAQK